MPQRGFTLLELLVVLGIAALALTVVGVRGEAVLERSRYHQAVRDVAALLNAGRTKALLQGHDVAVRFDPSGPTLAFGQEPDQRVDIPSFLTVTSSAADGGPGVAADPLFVFRGDGSAHGGELSVLRGDSGVKFRINWALGSVEQLPAVGPI